MQFLPNCFNAILFNHLILERQAHGDTCPMKTRLLKYSCFAQCNGLGLETGMYNAAAPPSSPVISQEILTEWTSMDSAHDRMHCLQCCHRKQMYTPCILLWNELMCLLNATARSSCLQEKARVLISLLVQDVSFAYATYGAPEMCTTIQISNFSF